MDCHEYTLDIDDICLHSEQCDAKPSTQIQYELTLDGIVVGKGTLGFRGNGIKEVSSIPSTEDEGENTITITADDGQKFSFKVRNGSRGNGITKITYKGLDETLSNVYTIHTTDGLDYDFTAPKGDTGNGIASIDVDESQEDNGENVITVNYTDGTKKTFKVLNGSKGTAAGFGAITASVDANVGTPIVDVTSGGTNEAKTFSFAFKNIRGNGIKTMDVTRSTEDEGENTIEFTFLDGTKKSFVIENGSKGNGITSIDVVPSSADAGANKVTVNFTDGWSKTFDVYNGHTGQAAGFGTPTISIDDTYGTPEASVTATGPDTAKVFHIDLKHLRGNGIESMDFTPSSADGGTNTIVFNLSDGTKKTIQVLNGSKGSKGDTGDAFSVSKVYSSIAEMNAGYATDGVKVGGFVVIDTGNVEDEDNAKLFVKGDTQYDYLTDMSGAQGIQGPRGVGISSIEQTTTSTASEGVNEATISLTDGSSYKIRYRNGAKGAKGDKGDTGDAMDIGLSVVDGRLNITYTEE